MPLASPASFSVFQETVMLPNIPGKNLRQEEQNTKHNECTYDAADGYIISVVIIPRWAC